MRRSIATALLALLLVPTSARAQSVARFAVDSTVSVSQWAGENAPQRPDVIVDVTATARLGGGWVAYIRPWFRQAGTSPYPHSRQIYQAALQHEHQGRVATRVDAGYILAPIGLGMLDMRPDTNPVISTHLSYMVPMPTFDPGAPASKPIASSYPLGGQFTVSSGWWDLRTAVMTSPPNRTYVLNADNVANPSARPVIVVGGGVTPTIGLRIGAAYATGEYASSREITRGPRTGRTLHMASVEAEYSVGYSKFTGEFTRDRLETASSTATATQWFVQGLQTLRPRWFVAGRYEGASAPPVAAGAARPTLKLREAVLGFRVTPELTLRSGVTVRKLYFSATTDRQFAASIVWARRWW